MPLLSNIVFIVPALVLLFGVFFVVKQKTAVIIERLGKFQKHTQIDHNPW